MNKEFIPYEQALELKELGFDEPCLAINNGDKLFYGAFKSTHAYYKEYAVILYQQAFRWFRENYNIDAWVQPFATEKSNGTLFLPDESYSYYIFKDGVFVADKVDLFDHEEAELACLKKLIELVKNK